MPTAIAITNAKRPLTLFNDPSTRPADEEAVAAAVCEILPVAFVALFVVVVKLPLLAVVLPVVAALAVDSVDNSVDVPLALALPLALEIVAEALPDADDDALLEFPVKLDLSSSNGVKLYASGPTLATFDAGPTMICIA